jgi:hypothetical protein
MAANAAIEFELHLANLRQPLAQAMASAQQA